MTDTTLAQRDLAALSEEQLPESDTFFAALRRNPAVLLSLAVVLAWIVLAILAPAIAPTDPLAQNVSNRLQAPSNAAWMGTDELGRDVFTRVLWGGRITIPAALVVVAVVSVVGSLAGALAGYIGGIWDELLMRLTDLFMAFPTIILAMAITAALGADIRNAMLALIVVRWPSYSRLTRGLILEAKSKEYVEATRSLGAGHAHILLRTLLPNAISPALVYASLDIGNAILLFAGLSFLGLGPEPSSPEWGRMVSIGIQFFDQWWMWLFPGLAIASLVMAFNFIGDGLRDILDPRTRK
ncbi:MAG TPA: ABC transporter permease [Candidatus Sulfomarinibacteraceae bacterium]|nr:ABC transporter permease [Candidatus Sulfomarinibacteraceae bacterium]